MSYRSLLLCALLPLSGCFIYFGDGDDSHGDAYDDDYDDDGWDDTPPPPIDAGCAPRPDSSPNEGLRDPFSGACVNWGGGPGCKPRAPLPDWPACYTECNGLGETDCQDSASCVAVYTGEDATFAECWALGGEPWEMSACADISEAESCWRRADCSMHYSSVPGQWLGCLPEEAAPPPPPTSCFELDEATCIDYTDGCAGEAACAVLFCEPLYEGEDCTCGPAGCDCTSWAYIGCRGATP
jgi:hypothetical protein